MLWSPGSTSLEQRMSWPGRKETKASQSQLPCPVLSTPTPSPTATPSGYTLSVRSASQNVRSGPGLNFDVIGQLPRGTRARILGATTDYSWLVIDFQGQLGWLAAYLVDTFGNRNLVPLIQPPLSPYPARHRDHSARKRKRPGNRQCQSQPDYARSAHDG